MLSIKFELILIKFFSYGHFSTKICQFLKIFQKIDGSEKNYYITVDINVLMLCKNIELILKSYEHFLKLARGINFFQNLALKSPQFLLHFLIHIDVLMLYRKFELIPTEFF